MSGGGRCGRYGDVSVAAICYCSIGGPIFVYRVVGVILGVGVVSCRSRVDYADGTCA